jgi:hypothetical protein
LSGLPNSPAESMSTVLLNNPDSTGVVYYGPHDNPRKTRYWAERGIINIEDVDTGDFEQISVREFLLRVNANSEMLRNTIAKEGAFYADEINRIQRMVEQCADLARKAQEQGLPPRLGGLQFGGHVGSTTMVPRKLGKKYVFD